MDSFEIVGLLLLGAVAWLWLDSLKTRELAIAAARAACRSEEWLLLDDTVAIRRLGLARDGDGALLLHRVYGFEYSDTGDNRRTGSIAMLGKRVLAFSVD